MGLFSEYGFETWGIDISPGQVQSARAFEALHRMALNIQQGDMRQILFADEIFDYVYEYYSIAHLSKADTGRAVQEMCRVLKPGGWCFVSFMSAECWPVLGRLVNPGEFRLVKAGRKVLHSTYQDNEPDQYFSGWNIIQKDKSTS